MDLLKEKQAQIKKLGNAIQVWNMVPIGRDRKSRVQKLQDNLSFTLQELEKQGMDAKIKTMEEVLTILKEQ